MTVDYFSFHYLRGTDLDRVIVEICYNEFIVLVDSSKVRSCIKQKSEETESDICVLDQI